MKATPNLFIVGTPKSYTTSLHDWLSEQPSVGSAATKEVGTLLCSPWVDEPWSLRTVDFNGEATRYRLDSSPWVFYDRFAANRLQQSDLGRLSRVVISLRDPLTRACSMHRDQNSAGVEHDGLDQAFRRELSIGAVGETDDGDDYPIRRSAYLRQSDYSRHLAAWLAGFSPDQLRIFFPDTDHEPQLRELCSWLKLDPPSSVKLPTSNAPSGPRPLAPYMDALRIKLRHRTLAYRLWRRAERFGAPLIFFLSNLQRGSTPPRESLGAGLTHDFQSQIGLESTIARLIERYALGPLPSWAVANRTSSSTIIEQGGATCAGSSA